MRWLIVNIITPYSLSVNLIWLEISANYCLIHGGAFHIGRARSNAKRNISVP